MLRILLALTILLIPAFGQTSAGRLTGSVTDPSGASVPGASITAANVATNVAITTSSNAQGSYVLYPLPPAAYDITVNAPGFRPEKLTRVEVEVAAVINRDFRLQVGTQDQSITVSADAPTMMTESPSVQSMVTREQIEAIPLNGRDFNSLVLLSAGAVENANAGRDFGPVAANGNRAFSNEYRLDGAPNNDIFFGRSGASVSVDAIQEFKVTSGVASAEFGRAGTQITMATRGGTNKLRGSAFEFHRGNVLEARNPFNTLGIQPFRRDQFGGSLGGPIRKNRTFFFGNYEANRLKQNVTRVATVPPDAFWKGDFSSLLSRNIQLRDPLVTGRPLIPNNRLDLYMGGSRIDSLALRLRPFYGSPNKPGLANNLLQFPLSTNSSDQYTLRFDHLLPRNHSISFRYNQTQGATFSPSILGNGTGVNNVFRNYNGSLSWTVPVTSRIVNELRLSYVEAVGGGLYESAGLPTIETLGMIGFDPPDPIRAPMPRMSFAGNDAYTTLNYGPTATFGQSASSTVTKTMTLSDSFTWVTGRHTLKAGFEHNRFKAPSIVQPGSSGIITYRSANVLSSGHTFADFLMGLPASAQQTPAMQRLRLRQGDFNFYFQDDWRITSRLTLNLGVRHELYLSPFDEFNRLSLFDPATGAMVVASNNGQLPEDRYSPVVAAKLRDASGNWRFPLISDRQAGFNPRRLIATQYGNVAPRAGLVLRITNRTALRTGYGIFYTRYPFQYLFQTLAINPPFSGQFTYNQAVSADGVPAVSLRNPFGGAGSANVSPGGLQQNFQLPDNQQWNLTLERNIGWETIMSLGYVGNKGTHLFRSANANGPYLDSATGAVLRRYAATYGNVPINMRLTNGNSIYHAMQTEFRRRSRKGLIFQANWTWAKGIDDVANSVNANALDVENLGRDRADSDYVRRHLVKVNGAWELPFGRGKLLLGQAPRWAERIIGGWRLSGVWQYSTGARFTPTFTTTGGLGNNRPDVVPGGQGNLPRAQRTASRWFNAAAFAEVPTVDPVTGAPRYGNAGRNILIGPGLNVADTNLSKTFTVGRETNRLSFRLELFNVFNHPNYELPDGNISNINTVGTINETLRPMRQAQFAVRFDF